MNEQLQAVLLGAGISAAVALGLGVLGIWAETRRASRRMAHEARLAAEQREHEKAERRYDDLRSAYTAFATEMRAQIAAAHRFEQRNQYGYVDDPQFDPADDPGYRYGAEENLQALQLFADDGVYRAARAYLDSYYVRFWGYPREDGISGDVRAAEAAFVREGKRALGLQA